MRAKRDGKQGWIPLCKGEVTGVSTEWARLRKGEAMAAEAVVVVVVVWG